MTSIIHMVYKLKHQKLHIHAQIMLTSLISNTMSTFTYMLKAKALYVNTLYTYKLKEI